MASSLLYQRRKYQRSKKSKSLMAKFAEEASIAEEIRSSNGWLTHYSFSNQILLVGEGDFSFSLCLAKSFGSASNIVATSLDSHDSVISKYKEAKSNLKKLEKLGASHLHKVDATKMKLHTDLRMRKFDRIIFNFPHAGFHGKEDQVRLIKMHRDLVQGFFRNARGMLRPYGEIHVSHKTSGPFLNWNLEDLASRHSLELVECVEFKRDDYPGYKNKRGDGSRCDEPFRLGKCSTFKFILSRHGFKYRYRIGRSVSVSPVADPDTCRSGSADMYRHNPSSAVSPLCSTRYWPHSDRYWPHSDRYRADTNPIHIGIGDKRYSPRSRYLKPCILR